MIEINNLTTNQVDENFLRRTAKIILEGESSFAKAIEDKVKKEVDVSIAFVGQGRMREINKDIEARTELPIF